METWWIPEEVEGSGAEAPESVWSLSVRELAGVGGSVAAEDVGGAVARLQLGNRLHEAYRRSMTEEVDGFVAERFVQARFEIDGQSVLVSGRIDGLFQDDSGCWLVEELKSVVVPAGDLASLAVSPDRLESYRWQCRIYEHLLALELGPATCITGRLVLADVITGVLTRMDVPYEPDTVTAFVARRLQELVAHRRARMAQADRRRAWAATLGFPHSSHRPYQDSVMDDVAGAALRSLNLALSAPTGIGKTVASLYPMLRVSASTEHRLLFSTAKVSQQQLALDTLERMIEPGCGVCAVQLEAKERSCPQEEILCLPGHCKRLQAHQARMIESSLPGRLLEKGVVRAEDIRREAERFGLCPFELALAAVYAADVVVCDVNYVAHPRVGLDNLARSDQGAARPRPWNLVIDEAHALYSRAIEFLSPSLSLADVRILAEGALSGASPVYRRLVELLGAIEDLFSEVIEKQEQGPRAGQPKAVVELERGPWQQAALDIEIWLLDYLSYIRSGGRRPLPFVPRRKEGSRRIIDPVIDFSFQFMEFAQVAEQRSQDRAMVLDVEEGRKDAVLRSQCLDPSRYLAERFESFDSVVAMSATLEPIEFYLEGLGLGSRPSAHSVYPSPFPRDKRLIVADVSVSTRYKDRSQSLPEVASKIAAIGSLRPGNVLVFFPSYAYLKTAAALVEAHLRRRGATTGLVVVGSSQQAPEVLEHLRQRAQGPQRDSLLVFTVLGGSLAEGVDFPDEMAHTALVVGPGLPMVTFERGLMLAYHDAKDGQGFEHAYLYPGLTSVIQAAGRVIRSETDVGAMVLLGERFGQERYRRLLPEYWQEEMLLTADAVEEVRRFWQDHGKLKPKKRPKL